MEYHELVVARSCSVARVGHAELLELGARWRGGTVVSQWHDVAVLKFWLARSKQPVGVCILRMCLGLCLGKFGGNTRIRRNLALIPNMMYLRGGEQW